MWYWLQRISALPGKCVCNIDATLPTVVVANEEISPETQRSMDSCKNWTVSLWCVQSKIKGIFLCCKYLLFRVVDFWKVTEQCIIFTMPLNVTVTFIWSFFDNLMLLLTQFHGNRSIYWFIWLNNSTSLYICLWIRSLARIIPLKLRHQL